MRTVAWLAFAWMLLDAQTAGISHFEVASVKPAASGKSSQRGGPGTADPGQIVYANVDLNSLIFEAYEVRPHQLSEPAWMLEEHYDIIAKVPAGATRKDLRLMIRNLLVERFQLKVHHESRESEAYALTVGRNGARLPAAYPMAVPDGFIDDIMPRPTAIDKDGFFLFPPGYAVAMMGSADGQTRVTLVREPMAEFCKLLSRAVQLPVVDQTGLTGRYDAHLRFAADPPATPAPSGAGESNGAVPAASDPAPPLLRAIENQLGLKLERKKLPVDFLVVESASKTPTEN